MTSKGHKKRGAPRRKGRRKGYGQTLIIICYQLAFIARETAF